MASNIASDERIFMQSPLIFTTIPYCLSFWYYRNDPSLGPFYINDLTKRILTIQGIHGNKWNKAQINIQPGYHKVIHAKCTSM